MSSIKNNRAVDGGGVYALGEGVVLHGRSQIARNDGGGIYSNFRHRIACDVTMYGTSSVRGNRQGPKHASDGGGIVGCNRVEMNARSTVHHNEGSAGVAGISAMTVVMSNHARVSDNIAVSSGGGGGIAAGRAVVMHDQSRVVRNVVRGARTLGGGIAVESGQVRLSDAATVARNSADLGGGIAAINSDVILHNRASVIHNTATRTGGGVFSWIAICTTQRYKVLTHAESTISSNVPNDIVQRSDTSGCP
jgi:hypothetical protein